MSGRKSKTTIRVGSAVVTLYNLADRNRYCIVYTVDGKRHREVRADFEAAKERAKEVAVSIAAQTAKHSVLTATEAEVYRNTIESLKPLGVPLAIAVQDYIAARKRIGAHSLTEAADYFARNANFDLPNRTLAELLPELIEAKTADGVSLRYRQELARELEAANKVLAKPVSEITSAEIDDFLRSLTVGSRSRQNTRAVLVTAFRFARSRGYLPRDRNTAADISTRVKVKTGEVEIFTPHEMAALLAAADADTLPLIALGAFAGLRTAEISRLEWKDIDFAQDIITVSAAKSKTASRRIVPIQPNLAQWLAPWMKTRGPVMPVTHLPAHSAWARLSEREARTAAAAKVQWKHNALRHSYGSYRLAKNRNAAEVALEMGNSPQMIFKHYRELVTPRDAAAWWAIAPERAGNVISMQAKAQQG